MSTWNIYHKDGSKLTDVNEEQITVHGLEYSDSWMGECFVTINFKHEVPINFQIGDYIVYRGERFELNYEPGKDKQARPGTYGDGFIYDSVKFNALQDELSRAEFLDVVLNDNELHYTALPKFPFYVQTLDDLLDRIQANLDDQIGAGLWKIYSRNMERSVQRGCLASDWLSMYGEGTRDNVIESMSITVDSMTCWQALALVNEKWDINFIVRGRNIYVGTTGIQANHIFKYGLGNGLYEIVQNADSDQSVVTRLRAYGSEKNLPSHYYADLGVKYVANITKVVGASTNVELELDVDYIETYFKNPRKYIVSGETGEQSSGWVLKVTFDFKTEITGYVTQKYNTNKCRFYSEYRGTQVDSGDEESRENLNTFIAQVKAGNTKMYITSGLNKKNVPSSMKEYAENLPNNMSINRLMLPGFPHVSLSDFYDSLTDEEKKYVNPTGKQHRFSTDPYRPYIDSVNIEQIGLRSASQFFDTDDKTNGVIEIYPTIEEMVIGGVRVDEIDEGVSPDDDGRFNNNENVKNVDIYLSKAIDFDINDLKDDDFSIYMKDGMCGGRTFQVASSTKVDGRWRLTIERIKDDALELWFPYKDYTIKKGDHFVLTGITLPDSYVNAASLKLLKYAIALLDKNDYTRYVYQPKVDEIFMARQHDQAQADDTGVIKSLHDTLKAGDLMNFNDTDLNIEGIISIDQLTIKEEDGKIPTYDITLREDKEVGTIQKIQQQISSLQSGNGGTGAGLTTTQVKNQVATEGSKHFISKINDDIAKGTVTWEKVQKFFSGLFVGNRNNENGGSWTPDAEGRSHLITDYLEVRMKAIFEELVIKKTSTISGKEIISPAGGVVAHKVEEVTVTYNNVSQKAYRCYFLAEQDGDEVDNDFAVNDQVRSESFNVRKGTYHKAGNHFYWRLVIGRDEDPVELEGKKYHYIDLSDTDCATASDVPAKGDVLNQCGNRTDVERQNCLIFSAVDTYSPSISLYHGINSYSFANKEYVEYGVNKQTNKAFFNVYGDMYVGDRPTKENGYEGSSYIKYDSAAKQVSVKGKISAKSTVDGKELSQYIKENSAKGLTEEQVNNIIKNSQVIADLQNQVDGAIETWFYEGVPTLKNAPASSWATDKEKDTHLGDLYYDNKTGKAYRFAKDGNTYKWTIITDTDIAKALSDASKAQETADGKMKVFSTQPIPPYQLGDIWVNATYPTDGSIYKNEILRCQTAKAKGSSFAIADWTKASKYTDDSALNTFKEEYKNDMASYKEQLDEKVETWFYNYAPTTQNKPASDWTTDTLKSQHAGDLFYNTSNGYTYRWTGTAWARIKDNDINTAMTAASKAQDTADGKRTVFTSQPTVPYDEGDLWASGGDDGKTLMVCVKSRVTGSFTSSEWVKANDSDLNAFAKTIEESLKGIRDQLDKKAETWYQATDPSTSWTTDDAKKEHKGDLWYNTSNNQTFFWNGAKWDKQDVPTEVFDKIDGKSSIYVSKPASYEERDLWILEAAYTLGGVAYSKGELVVATKTNASFSVADWTKKVKYTDDTVANAAKKAAEEAKKAADTAQTNVTNLGKTVTSNKQAFDNYVTDGYLEPSEIAAMAQDSKRLEDDFAAAEKSYNEVKGAEVLKSTKELTDLNTAFTTLSTAKTELIKYLSDISKRYNASDTNGKAIIVSAVGTKFTNFQSAYSAFYDKLGLANAYITSKIYGDLKQNITDLAGYKYLKDALGQTTDIDGGLVMTTLLALRDAEGNVQSGINGAIDQNRGKKSIATWWGGQMVDKDYNSGNLTPATSLIRFDGSGYLASGAIWWDVSGKVHADPTSFIISEKNLGAYLTFFEPTWKAGSAGTSVADLVSLKPNAPFTKLGVSGDATFEGAISFHGIKLTYDATNKAIKIDGNLYATGGISAYGASDATSGGGGLNGSVKSYADALKLTSESLSEVASAYSIKALSRRIDNIATELGGLNLSWNNITGKPSTFTPSAHTHKWTEITDRITKVSQLTNDAGYLTAHQSLASYYTKSSVDSLLSGKSATSHTHSVKINGVTKTIAATGGTAVDLGTYLTSHQTIYGLTIQKNGTSLGTYTPNSAAKTINVTVPTKLSELSNDSGYTKNTGTVTSVAISVPTGLSVSGSPITTNGTIAIALASGYSIPTTAKQTAWDGAVSAKHTHSNKSVLDGISSTKVSHWNSAYDWYALMTTDEETADGVINKWNEVVSFLANIAQTDTLSGIVDGINKSISDEVTRAKKAEGVNASGISANKGSIATLQGYFTNGSAKKALQLTNARKLWGNSFNGTADINGSIIVPSGKYISIGNIKLEYDAANKALKITNTTTEEVANLYTSGGVSAYGVGASSSSGGGLNGSVKAYADAIRLTTENLSEIASAYSIAVLNNSLNAAIGRISTLEGGSATSIETTGSGNAVTSVSKSGTKITFTKGSTFSLNGHTHDFITVGANQTITATQYENNRLSVRPYNNSGGPTVYGNILEVVGRTNGGGQLGMEWSGSQTKTDGTDTNVGKLYYRSKRDNKAGWTVWKRLAFAEELAWGNISGKPTSLSGYGITDGVNAVSVTGSGNAVTAASVSGHTLTLTKGSSFSLSNHTHYIGTTQVQGSSAEQALTGITKIDNILKLSKASVTVNTNYKAEQNRLVIYGSTYGNDANYIKSAGKLSYGDGGPQLVFSTGENPDASGAKSAALIYTDNDTIGAGVSLSFVTNQGDAYFIAPHIKALSAFQGNLAWSYITNKPTTLSGFGIMDGLRSVTQPSGSNVFVTGISTSGTAITYTKSYTKKSLSAVGTSGWTNASIDGNIIPDMSFIAYWNGAYSGTSSNLAYCNKGAFGSFAIKNSLAFSELTSKPTTISGYGITDAYTKSQVDAIAAKYLPLTGGTLTGQLKIVASALNGAYNGLRIGDDCYIGDCNIGNTIGLMGVSNNNAGMVKFGKGGMQFGYNGSNHIASTTAQWTNLNADLLDGWHKDNIVWSGAVNSNTASLSHYWAKLFDITVTDNRYDDRSFTFLFSNGYNDTYSVVVLRIRQNGAKGSGAYNFNISLRELVGNMSSRLRVYYNNATGNVQLWGNCQDQYGSLSYTIIKKTGRTSADFTSQGTLVTNTSFSAAQSLPATTGDSPYTLLDGATRIGIVKQADQLVTARSLWGQSFNGTANVSGNMTGVGNINTSAAPAGTIYTNNWFRSKGSTGWYSEDHGGGWYMSDNTWIRNFGGKDVYLSNKLSVNGNVGIGTTAPSHKLHVSGEIYTTTKVNINGIVLEKDSDGNLKVNGNLYATGGISAYGTSSAGSGGGLSGSVKSYADALKLTSESLSEIASAYSIKQLSTRITSLEGGSATSISVSGGGNAVTSVTKNGTTISVVKGSTFSLSGHTHKWADITDRPSSLKNPSALSWSGYSSGSYDGSAAKSISIPNNTNQLTNGAGFITASASITGNAATATKVNHSLSVFGKSFNGSADVTVADTDLIASISTATANLTDKTEILTSWASDNGFNDSNAKNRIYRRPASAIWGYINSKTISNADKLDNVHLNGIFTALSNTNNGVSMTIGTVAKSLANMQVYSATKLVTARNIALNGDFTGNANFDGSANITINGYMSYCNATVGNTNTYPWRRIAKVNEITGNYSDGCILLYISEGFIGGCYGIARVYIRTDNLSTGANASCSIQWISRNGYGLDSLKIAMYKTTGKAYYDVFLKMRGWYGSVVIRTLQDQRGGLGKRFTLVNSTETTNAASHTEAYATIEDAATAIHHQAYTSIAQGSDVATVHNADMVDGIHASGLFTNLSNSGNSLSITVGGTNKTLTVNYASNAGNADTVDSLHVHSGRNSEANKIVRTDGNGFIQCGYINSDKGNEGNNSSPARVWGTNGSDNYLRSYLTSALSVKYAASAGNADTLDGVHASGLFTNLSNSGNNISITIGGTNKTLTAAYAKNCDTVDGYHAQLGSSKPYGKIPVIGTDGVIELGHYIDFHHDNTTGSDYSVRLQTNGNHSNVVTLPTETGTLALTSGNVASATKLQTARTIWGQSFNGTANVSGALSGATTISASNTISTTLQNGALKIGNKLTPISAIDAQVIFNTGAAIRFGETNWNWDMWAGLKYTHSNKTVYLGIADGSVFRANNAQSYGKLQLKAIDSILFDSDSDRFQIHCDNDYERLRIGSSDNSGYVLVSDIGNWDTDGEDEYGANNWRISIDGSSLFKKISCPSIYTADSITSTSNKALLLSGNVIREYHHGGSINYSSITFKDTTLDLSAYGNIGLTSVQGITINGGNGTISMVATGGFGVTYRAASLSVSQTGSSEYTWTFNNGSIKTTGGITAYQSSDERLKHNIHGVDSLAIIKAMGGTVAFRYNEDDKASIGWIAQRVLHNTLMQDLVEKDEDGYLKINYWSPKLIAVAFGAIEQVDDEVAKLKARVRELENEVEQLKSDRL